MIEGVSKLDLIRAMESLFDDDRIVANEVIGQGQMTGTSCVE